jgi:hypothetical protein
LPEVFREGAKDSARGGRAPHSTSEFGFKREAFKRRNMRAEQSAPWIPTTASLFSGLDG